ncbi:endonuclease/exonuclease/phosphatase family protein [Brachybacterium saurashtrense]|uniref:Metal-dependent hydrolase n=1 Tax=Brachybacterium saurashtrense TaxID=556288 RepID=A0A345YL50_9MICO|nr:endonuclease/exonuclease/phosphatase family protein [Brachybacterium saurashtrense]AXK44652.1 metal-dependent hydrolase [Brachybacterium saurashtrense]RRR23264.1 metal-dependent hydrolase [Brachybacterium saurashtrense]
MTTWRVATWNIRHGLGPDGRVDLERTAREIAALGADVIALQEVDVAFGARSAHEDQAARLGALLGMSVAFGAALDLPPEHDGAPRRRYGVALLTRHEIVSSRMHPLPGAPLDAWAGTEADEQAGAPGADGDITSRPASAPEPRGVLHVRVAGADGAGLDVRVTHLDATHRAHRAVQVQELVSLVAAGERTGCGSAPDGIGAAVLLGDLNAEPTAPELTALPRAGWREAADQLLHRRGAHGPVRADRADRAVRLLEGGRRLLGALRALCGVPGRRPDRATHPARFPLRRLDQVWLRGGVTATSLEVGGRGSSDHRPVVATLRLER